VQKNQQYLKEKNHEVMRTFITRWLCYRTKFDTSYDALAHIDITIIVVIFCFTHLQLL